MVRNMLITIAMALCFFTNCEVIFAGELHGTITWQYNNFVGTRGDTGAKIFLWPTNYDKSTVTPLEEDTWILGVSAPKNKNCFLTQADGYGNFDIYDIPAGEYIIFVLSRNTSHPPTQLQPYINYFSKYFQDIDKFAKINLSMFKFTFATIKISNERINRFSYDFGYTYMQMY